MYAAIANTISFNFNYGYFIYQMLSVYIAQPTAYSNTMLDPELAAGLTDGIVNNTYEGQIIRNSNIIDIIEKKMSYWFIE